MCNVGRLARAGAPNLRERGQSGTVTRPPTIQCLLYNLLNIVTRPPTIQCLHYNLLNIVARPSAVLCSTCWRLWSSGSGQPGSVTTDPPLVPSLSMHLECWEDSGSVFQKWYFKRYKSYVTTALPNLDAFQCTSMWQQKTWRRVDDISIRSQKKAIFSLW